VTKPKCIIMPFQEPEADGIGLSLHFLLANLIAVHNGFAECWFGYWAGRIFSSPDTLMAYTRMQDATIDQPPKGAQQKIRFWIHGQMSGEAVRLSLSDNQKKTQTVHESFTFSTLDHLVGFRKQIIEWLRRCGLPMTIHRLPNALWHERSSLEGLRRIGQALEKYYIHSAFGNSNPINISFFETAVNTAPESFMANNLLGWAHYRNRNAPRAKRYFERALALNPYSPGVASGLMWCAFLERDEEATVYWASQKAAFREEDVAAAAVIAHKRFE
jgi:tetratricopeptide (TPR) repeat protein